MSLTRSEINKRHYAKRINLGQCQSCERKAVEGRTYCEVHLARQHSYHVKRYIRHPYPIKPSKYLTDGNNT